MLVVAILLLAGSAHLAAGRASTVTGVVLLPDGTPAAGAEVWAMVPGVLDGAPGWIMGAAGASADAEGRFVLDAPAGEFALSAATPEARGLLVGARAGGDYALRLEPANDAPAPLALAAEPPAVAADAAADRAVEERPARLVEPPASADLARLVAAPPSPASAAGLAEALLAHPLAVPPGAVTPEAVAAFPLELDAAGVRTPEEAVAEALAGGRASLAAPEGEERNHPLVTLHVNGRSYPWAALVYFPADLNGDLVPDSLVWLTYDGARVCLNHLLLVTLSQRPMSLGVGHGSDVVVMASTGIPGSLKVCGVASATSPGVSLDSSSPRGNFAAQATSASGGGVDFRMAVPRMPGSVRLDLGVSTTFGKSVTYAYRASESLDVVAQLVRPIEFIAVVKGFPTSVEGEFSLIEQNLGGGITQSSLRVRYDASGSVSEVIARYADATQANYAQVELYSVPVAFDGSATWKKSPDAVYYASYRQSASSAVSRLLVDAKAGGTPLRVQLENLPATITDAYYHLLNWGDLSQYRAYFRGSSGARNLLVRFAQADGYVNYVAVAAPDVPSYLYGTLDVRVGSGGLQSFAYGHEASAGVSRIQFDGKFGGGNLNVYADARGIPATAQISFYMRSESNANVSPSVSYTGSAAGLTIAAVVTGNALGGGGRVEALLENLPTRLTTSLAYQTSNPLAVVTFGTAGTGKAARVYLHGKLPILLPVAGFQDVVIDIRDLQRFTVELDGATLTGIGACPSVVTGHRVCMYFNDRQASYASLQHGAIALDKGFLRVGVDNLRYTTQQLETCYSGGSAYACWQSKYYATTTNVALWYPAWPLDPAKATRALGVKL